MANTRSLLCADDATTACKPMTEPLAEQVSNWLKINGYVLINGFRETPFVINYDPLSKMISFGDCRSDTPIMKCEPHEVADLLCERALDNLVPSWWVGSGSEACRKFMYLTGFALKEALASR